MADQKIIEKLLQNTLVGDDCWEWSGTRNGQGYGQFSYKNTTIRAHRAMYELLVGEIPDGMLLCHKCDNPSCVNPSHMFIGTQKDNMRDCIEKGRLAPVDGERNGHAVLTKESVADIRERLSSGETQVSLASVYGVAPSTISWIARNEHWRV